MCSYLISGLTNWPAVRGSSELFTLVLVCLSTSLMDQDWLGNVTYAFLPHPDRETVSGWLATQWDQPGVLWMNCPVFGAELLGYRPEIVWVTHLQLSFLPSPSPPDSLWWCAGPFTVTLMLYRINRKPVEAGRDIVKSLTVWNIFISNIGEITERRLAGPSSCQISVNSAGQTRPSQTTARHWAQVEASGGVGG